MPRLYLKFYFALLGSLIVFAIAAGLFWHLLEGAEDRPGGSVSRLLQNALPASDVTPAGQQAALQALFAGVNVDITLVGSDHATLARVGQALTLPGDADSPVGTHAMRAEGIWMIELSDGRRLFARTPMSASHVATVLGTLLTLALVVGLAAYPVVRRLSTRLERLHVGVESLGAGQLSARVRVEGRDEIARLADSFNHAASRIEALVGAHKSLLANASHELRTPLTRIRLAVELMRHSTDPARAKGLNDDVAELDQLIDEILLASRLDAVTSDDIVEDIDVLALAAEECSRYPEAELDGTAVHLRGDARLLRRLFRNLLENARRHGVAPTQVTLRGIDGGAQLIVSDSGPGIPAHERERIFAPFFRREGSAGSGGAGLGLSLVRQIAQRHGGDARCEAAPDGRMRFVVTLGAGLIIPVATAT
jgi:signal transduction histidine kinase